MSFSRELLNLPTAELVERSKRATREDVASALGRSNLGLDDFATLLSPAGSEMLQAFCGRSQMLTRQRFGRVMRLFAPLYLSNECINNCKYCGFSRDNPILRVTLAMDEVRAEAAELGRQGFRSILLVAGEHPKFVSDDYLADCVRGLVEDFPTVALEVGPMQTAQYAPLSAAGAEGLVVYQETYHPEIYSQVHTAGPKRDFSWRLDTAQRAYDAGFRRLGIGALFGLADWRYEAISLAQHAAWLLRNCWKAQVTVAFPRLRPHAGAFQPLTHLSDRELVQLVCAFRLVFPDVGLVLSTREPARLRNLLFQVGITHASAGSHTEPGGYTGAGREKIHLTQKGRVVALTDVPNLQEGKRTAATEQFEIADERSPQQIAQVLETLGYEAVWKDWEPVIADGKH